MNTSDAQSHPGIREMLVQRVQPLANGHAFGPAGSYERVSGVAKGVLDPADPRNAGIVNLALAPRDTQGLVAYQADFYLLRPTDPARGNGTLLYEVCNRGLKMLMHSLAGAPTTGGRTANDPATLEELGQALPLRLGYTLAWSGWDPDAPRANSGLALQAPPALEHGQPLVRTIRDEVVSGTRGPPLEALRLSYPAASRDPSRTRITMRAREADPPVELPPTAWAYEDDRTIRLLPAGTRPAPGVLYEVWYPATGARVLGVGFAATRDVVSYLRHGQRDNAGRPNPAGGSSPAGAGITAALAIGFSQGGRFLRDFIGQGFNQDLRRRRVFDGVLTHIAGVGRVFLNAEFGQPARTSTQHEDHLAPENEFPYSTALLTDLRTGRSGALFRGDGFDPQLIEVNTSTEYWQKGASLLHTDPVGRQDVALPERSRVYLVAGTQHTGRPGTPSDPGPCVNPRNPHDPSPALRALVVALEQWVREGREPPPSRVPTLQAGTLVPPERTGFPDLPGVAIARSAHQLVPFGDWVHPLPEPALAPRVLVPSVDADGNEVAGILLPDVAVPLGTHTGWNLYRAPYPEGELCDRDGSFLPFARTRADRERVGDPRPSLQERYGTAGRYVELIRAAAQSLVAERLLLPEDAERYVEQARQHDPLGE